jgi:hypothetical protein
MAQGPQHAMTPKDGLDAIATAASKLASANNFTKSVNKQAGIPDKPAAKPKASAPAATPVAKPEANHEAEDTGAGIRSNIDNMKAVQDSLPKYHKGGKIKKDGVQVIDAKKGETVLPTKDKKRATELAMSHLDGMKEGMEHAAKKHVKPMHTKKHGKVKKMHVHVNDDNTFGMTHEHNPNEDGSAVPDTTHSAPDMDGLIDHMQEHLGTPNPGEAAASAPAAPAAGAPAAA